MSWWRLLACSLMVSSYGIIRAEYGPRWWVVLICGVVVFACYLIAKGEPKR